MTEGRFLHEFDDETSMFDPEGVWEPGSEYYKRTYRVWLPNRLKSAKQELIDRYIEKHIDDPKLWKEVK